MSKTPNDLGAPTESRPRRKTNDSALLREGETSFRNSQLVDIGLLQRSDRSASAWRRLCFALLGIMLLIVIIALILATKDHVEGLVYRENVATGDLALVGMTSKNALPTDASVKHALVFWIQAVRDIPPGRDKALVNRNAQLALYMIDRGSPAYDAYRTFIHDDNPLDLAKKGYSRTVLDVEVDKLTDLTYRIAWHESLQSGGQGTPTTSAYSGTVTLAAAPRVPSDELVGQYNPAGIYIQDYDMRWSVLR
jgi:type IV secretory pathway TrbF-like protein